MKDYGAAVFIGRFQPFHNSHLEVVTKGLEIADELIIIVGSSTSARTFKNPFTFAERKRMILSAIEGTSMYPWGDVNNPRVHIYGSRDYYYNDEVWLAEIQSIVDQHVDHGIPVALLGSFKDSSSGYLKSFPQWDHIPMLPGTVHATVLRNELYHRARANSVNASAVVIGRSDGKVDPVVLHGKKIRPDWEGKLANPPDVTGFEKFVPANVVSELESFVKTPEFAQLAISYNENLDYIRSWETAPFPPTFVTTDAVVICSGHVLVIKRKFNPGKGLYALPGGFIKQSETIRAGALRELKEETGIRVDKIILDSSIVDSRVFDHPDRSSRGRTITHAFHIKLKDGVLPEVKGNDDAAGAMWMPLWDVISKEDQFFEDHAHIIHSFVGA